MALKRKRNGLLEKDGLPIFKSGFVPQVDSIDFPVVDLLVSYLFLLQKMILVQKFQTEHGN